MRPPGEIRRATLAAAWAVAAERAVGDAPRCGVTRLDVLSRLTPQGVGRQAVKHTWENLVRAGLLRPLPLQKVTRPGASRPLQAYEPVAEAEAGVSRSRCSAASLDILERSFWGRGMR